MGTSRAGSHPRPTRWLPRPSPRLHRCSLRRPLPPPLLPMPLCVCRCRVHQRRGAVSHPLVVDRLMRVSLAPHLPHPRWPPRWRPCPAPVRPFHAPAPAMPALPAAAAAARTVTATRAIGICRLPWFSTTTARRHRRRSLPLLLSVRAVRAFRLWSLVASTVGSLRAFTLLTDSAEPTLAAAVVLGRGQEVVRLPSRPRLSWLLLPVHRPSRGAASPTLGAPLPSHSRQRTHVSLVAPPTSCSCTTTRTWCRYRHGWPHHRSPQAPFSRSRSSVSRVPRRRTRHRFIAATPHRALHGRLRFHHLQRRLCRTTRLISPSSHSLR